MFKVEPDVYLTSPKVKLSFGDGTIQHVSHKEAREAAKELLAAADAVEEYRHDWAFSLTQWDYTD